MNSKNLSKAQLKFSELSLKSNSTANQQHPRSVSPRTQYKNSPEIHDLMRFRTAVMNKYVQTHDAYFRDMANALTPQIEDKIREYNRSQNRLN